LKLFANEYVRFEGRGDFDTESQDFNSFGLGTQLLNKREDQVRVRYNFNDGTVRQIESGIEFKLSERLKTGYYLRYDQREKEFIEQRAGIRMYSACNCWIFDLDVSDRIDPNETKVSFNITLVGLGEFGNSYFTDLFTRRQQTSLN
jgi:hypothetical protein